MNIEALQYFCEIAEEKSISKVAKKSHISQSALSQLIQKMEESLGQALLKRSNKGVELTEMGKIVLKYSENILINYDKMLEAMDELDHNNAKIRINATWSLVTYSLPCVLYRIKQKFPKYGYELVSSSNQDTLRDVQNDICDFGIIDQKPKEDCSMNVHKIGTERYVLVASESYNVKEQIDFEELFSLQLIWSTSNHNVKQLLENRLRQQCKTISDLNIIFEIDNIGAIKSSINNGFGAAFLPYVAVKRDLYLKNMKIIDVKDLDLTYELYLVSKKMDSVSKEARDTIEYFKQIGQKSFC
ncbi:LysR family transcriptional regulator [Vallitalea okinawensis]|uniref:LysR family transcriptional regulator n=1 Tax=Vallitalea okinawensis TaxID=2078660 RepID=UPI001478D72C|nr:LysR family transcriptional regulator [Vallitalea okinawensis]